MRQCFHVDHVFVPNGAAKVFHNYVRWCWFLIKWCHSGTSKYNRRRYKVTAMTSKCFVDRYFCVVKLKLISLDRYINYSLWRPSRQLTSGNNFFISASISAICGDISDNSFKFSVSGILHTTVAGSTDSFVDHFSWSGRIVQANILLNIFSRGVHSASDLHKMNTYSTYCTYIIHYTPASILVAQ